MKNFSKEQLKLLFQEEYRKLYEKGINKVVPINDLPGHIYTTLKIYKYAEGSCKYLDVSIGSGFIARVLKQSGFNVWGVDGIFASTEKEINEARYLLKNKFEGTGIIIDEVKIEEEKLPYPENEFDMVYWGATIEHLHNSPKKPMNEMYRVLKPGGIFIISTPNILSLKHRLLLLLGISFMPSIEYVYNSKFHGGHHREYTMLDLIKVCKWTGYEIIEANYVDTFWSLSLKKFGKLSAFRRSEEEKSTFDIGFHFFNWYDWLKLFPMELCKIFPSFRETLLLICKKNY